ncbi:serine/threonine-protein kinase PEPKR2 [Phalaenopsis equestris]|uniref:serine/threonine-protein kinase PEPKR2 n=1 Tax=Phalaenopsis equestris TaxID=78828 RepID=UPI0009E51B60|nr:serine/threonine-protein kinase PEPKR2 [Phalaenopsis equestris]
MVMEVVRRKRKGIISASVFGSYLSDGVDSYRQCKKKCREGSRPDKLGPRERGAIPGVVMTAPPSGRSGLESPARGLKRKLGCIESVTQIGRKKKLEQEYILGREIGQGRFGSVRLCRSKASGEQFACKTLRKNGEETVHREVEIMQHISGHPNVVTLKAVFDDSECVHLVMELCSGGRLLDQMVKEGRYSEQRAANLLRDLAFVIKYCHDMGVVHRDIKPENILLTVSGKMKLADFGLAVRVANGQRLSGIAGSPAYVAPEVLSGHYSEKVDIWGAGVLLHALLVGTLPFPGTSREAIFEAIKTVELNFHGGMWDSVSLLARDLLSRMLTRDVSSRLVADEILRHPWILFYTEGPSNLMTINPITRNRSVAAAPIIDPGCLTHRSEEDQDECGGFVDALAAAISRVRISEPKRSRLCVPASQIPQECSSNMKANNLCTAF